MRGLYLREGCVRPTRKGVVWFEKRQRGSENRSVHLWTLWASHSFCSEFSFLLAIPSSWQLRGQPLLSSPTLYWQPFILLAVLCWVCSMDNNLHACAYSELSFTPSLLGVPVLLSQLYLTLPWFVSCRDKNVCFMTDWQSDCLPHCLLRSVGSLCSKVQGGVSLEQSQG